MPIRHCGWTACGGPNAGTKKSWDPDSDHRSPGRVSQLCSQLHHFTNKACEARGHSVSKWEEMQVQPLPWVPTAEDSPGSAPPSHAANPHPGATFSLPRRSPAVSPGSQSQNLSGSQLWPGPFSLHIRHSTVCLSVTSELTRLHASKRWQPCHCIFIETIAFEIKTHSNQMCDCDLRLRIWYFVNVHVCEKTCALVCYCECVNACYVYIWVYTFLCVNKC